MSYEQIDDLLNRHPIEDPARFSLYLRSRLLAALELPREEVKVHVEEKADFIDIVLRMAQELQKGPHGAFQSLHFYVFLKARLMHRDVLTDTWECHVGENFSCAEHAVDMLIRDLLGRRHGQQTAEEAGGICRRSESRRHWGGQLPGHRCDRSIDDKLSFPEYYNCAAALRELTRARYHYHDGLMSKLTKRAYKEIRSNVDLALGQRLPAELHDQIMELTISAEMPWRYVGINCTKCRIPNITEWERLERSKIACSCSILLSIMSTIKATHENGRIDEVPTTDQ